VTRPVVSVIVPTHDRPEALGRCLRALAAQRFPADSFEVIVVDDGSLRVEAVARAAEIPGLAVRFFRQPRSGPAAARNCGASRATGDLLAFTDDDCEPDPSWLAALVEGWRRRSDCMLGGQTINLLVDDRFATASHLTVAFLYDYFNRDPENAVFFASNNMAMPSDALRRINGFDATFGLPAAEDRELCDRWLHHGGRLAYVPSAVVGHAHHQSFRGFWEQHVRYGRGAEGLHRLRAQRGADPIRIEPPRFYFGLMLYPFGRTSVPRAMVLSILMALTQVATAWGFLNEAIATRRRRRGDRP
jgi:glycosyltransferase involved in cell wall biosynthesis